MFKNEKTVSSSLQPVLFWCSCLGILPFFDLATSTCKPKRVHLFLVVLIGVGLQATRWAHFFYWHYVADVGTYILTFGQQVFMTCLIVTMLSVSFRWNLHDFDDIFRYFNYVDRNVKVPKRKNLVLYYGLANVVLVVYWGYQGLLGWHLDGVVFMCSLIHQYHHLFNSILLQYLLLDVVLERRKHSGGSQRMTKVHGTLCEILGLYNDLFGWHAFFTAIFVNLRLLDVLHYMLINDRGIIHNLFKEAFPNILITVLYLSLPVKAEQIRKSLKSIERMSALLLNKHSDSMILADNLKLFCQQARHPRK